MLANAQGQLDQARSSSPPGAPRSRPSDAQLECWRGDATRPPPAGARAGRDRAARRPGPRARARWPPGRLALAELRQTRLDLGSQSDGFAARKDVLADDVARGESEVEALRTELHRRNSRLTSLREIQDRYEGFQRGTRAVMQRADEIVRSDDIAIHGVVADVVRAPELLEIAVEAAQEGIGSAACWPAIPRSGWRRSGSPSRAAVGAARCAYDCGRSGAAASAARRAEVMAPPESWRSRMPRMPLMP
jgi:chromosome segregation protein